MEETNSKFSHTHNKVTSIKERFDKAISKEIMSMPNNMDTYEYCEYFSVEEGIVGKTCREKRNHIVIQIYNKLEKKFPERLLADIGQIASRRVKLEDEINVFMEDNPFSEEE